MRKIRWVGNFEYANTQGLNVDRLRKALRLLKEQYETLQVVQRKRSSGAKLLTRRDFTYPLSFASHVGQQYVISCTGLGNSVDIQVEHRFDDGFKIEHEIPLTRDAWEEIGKKLGWL